jgi:hypothetical protein
VEASFSTLLDEEEEYEEGFEEDDELLLEGDKGVAEVDESLLVTNLGLCAEVSACACCAGVEGARAGRQQWWSPGGPVSARVATLCARRACSAPAHHQHTPPHPPCHQHTHHTCAQVVGALHRRNIQSLFPIQSKVLRPAMEGRDLVGRAKTGSGKTLAFALPVVEALLAEDKALTGRKAPGRAPRCVARVAGRVGGCGW